MLLSKTCERARSSCPVTPWQLRVRQIVRMIGAQNRSETEQNFRRAPCLYFRIEKLTEYFSVQLPRHLQPEPRVRLGARLFKRLAWSDLSLSFFFFCWLSHYRPRTLSAPRLQRTMRRPARRHSRGCAVRSLHTDADRGAWNLDDGTLLHQRRRPWRPRLSAVYSAPQRGYIRPPSRVRGACRSGRPRARVNLERGALCSNEYAALRNWSPCGLEGRLSGRSEEGRHCRVRRDWTIWARRAEKGRR